MWYYVGLILLAPWLMLQGKRVRRDTLKLPEPGGDRVGLTGHGEPIQLLIAGDSAAAGVGVDDQSQALSGSLVGALAKVREVRWQLEARTGHTSADLLQTLQQRPVADVDVAVLSIGVNDVTGMTPRAQWRGNLRAITEQLIEEGRASQIYFTSVPPMHRFPALPQPLRWWLGQRALQLNHDLRQVAKAYRQCTVVEIPFRGRADEIAVDGFHPGAEAYRVWGERVAGLIRAG